MNRTGRGAVSRLHGGRSGNGHHHAFDGSRQGQHGRTVSYAEMKTLDELDKEHKKLLEDMVPAQISNSGIRVLQICWRSAFRSATYRPFWKVFRKPAAMAFRRHDNGTCALSTCPSDFRRQHHGQRIYPLGHALRRGSRPSSKSGRTRVLNNCPWPQRLQEFVKNPATFEQQAQMGELPVLLTSLIGPMCTVIGVSADDDSNVSKRGVLEGFNQNGGDPTRTTRNTCLPLRKHGHGPSRTWRKRDYRLHRQDRRRRIGPCNGGDRRRRIPKSRRVEPNIHPRSPTRSGKSFIPRDWIG